jgi:Ca2+-dependent lipid-binding protein
VLDWNEHRKDNELGTANFDLKALEESPEQEGVVGVVMNDGKERGQLVFDINYFPVIKPKKLDDGTEEPVPETSCVDASFVFCICSRLTMVPGTGVVRFTVHQAKDLDYKLSSVGQLNPYAQVALRGQEVHKTQVLKRTNNPVFESPIEFLVTDRAKAVVGVTMFDERDLVKDPMVGYLNVKLDDLLDANKNGRDWFPFSGAETGRVRLSAMWKPVIMAGAINGAAQYNPPIGVVRFW